MLLLTAVNVVTLLTLTSAIPSRAPQPLRGRQADPVQQLLSIAPTSGSCANAPIAAECATASQAVTPLISSFATYNITSAAEQAALLSWMAFESADFKYNRNHFPAPGNPAQGT